MNKSVPIMALISAALMLVAVGCGGGDDSTTSSLTKAQFIKQADAICKKADAARLKALSETTGSQLEVLSAAMQPIQKQAEEIAALGAPSGDDEEIDAIVTEMEKGVEQAEKGGNANIEKAFVKVDQLSGQYGFKVCASTLF